MYRSLAAVVAIGVLATITTTLIVAPVYAAGAGPDHFRCYKVKDTLGKNEYTVSNITGLAGQPPSLNETNCTVKLPPKIACFPVIKVPGGTAPPPGGVPFDMTQDRPVLCYQTKCGKADIKAQPPVSGLQDQFGAHSLKLLAQSKLICAPACALIGAPCAGVVVPPSQCCSGSCTAGVCD